MMGAMRLADLLGGLSRLADLGFGIPAGEAVRSAALSLALSRALDLPDEDARAAMYTSLLHHVGCSGYAHEATSMVPDERRLFSATAQTNLAAPAELFTTFLPALTSGLPTLERFRLTALMLTRGQRIGVASTTAACEVGRDAARRLGLPDEVQHSIYRSYEWWNGKGVPGCAQGERIPLGARVAAVSSTAALLDTTADVPRVVEVVRGGSGSVFDPELAAYVAEHATSLLDGISGADPHALLLDEEPRPVVTVLEPHLRDVATVFGDLADLKSPYTHGHSRGVARLARAAGEALQLPTAEVASLEVGALLHDVGRVAVSSSVWEKRTPLSRSEWEQIRLHAYHSERILAGSERLAPLAQLVGSHHERCDGGGYHRGATRAQLTTPAAVLAAADVYQALTQERPHRPALTASRAAEVLQDHVSSGHLDEEAAGAVLAAAGHDVEVQREPPAGLTEREVEVLALLAVGHSNRGIADGLGISRRTAEHHVQHIYAKLGASSRAAAALFAMEHNLLGAGVGVGGVAGAR